MLSDECSLSIFSEKIVCTFFKNCECIMNKQFQISFWVLRFFCNPIKFLCSTPINFFYCFIFQFSLTISSCCTWKNFTVSCSAMLGKTNTRLSAPVVVVCNIFIPFLKPKLLLTSHVGHGSLLPYIKKQQN